MISSKMFRKEMANKLEKTFSYAQETFPALQYNHSKFNGAQDSIWITMSIEFKHSGEIGK